MTESTLHGRYTPTHKNGVLLALKTKFIIATVFVHVFYRQSKEWGFLLLLDRRDGAAVT